MSLLSTAPIDELCDLKWLKGREERGKKPVKFEDTDISDFDGDEMAELVAECIDSIWYLKIGARKRGFPTAPEKWPTEWLHKFNEVRSLCEWARRKIAESSHAKDK